MLYVGVKGGFNPRGTVLFVDVATGRVTVSDRAIARSPTLDSQQLNADGSVFAAFGAGSPDSPRFIFEGLGSTFALDGTLSVFDAGSRSVVEIPFPDIPSEVINPAVIVSPDGRHVVLTVRWLDNGQETARSWVTTTDGLSGWTPVEGGVVVGWVGE